MTYKTSGPLKFSEVKGLHHLDEDWWIETGIKKNAFQLKSYDGHLGSVLENSGRLICRKGYLWDGSSGPTKDGKPDPAASLFHDTCYEAFRSAQLHPSLRGRVDAIYRDLLRERGMGALRAGWRYVGLRLFGWGAAARSRGPQYPKRTAA